MAKQNPIRAVLEEELVSSGRMLGRYRLAMDRLPKGTLVAKRIKGRVFHYLARRHAGKQRRAALKRPGQADKFRRAGAGF